MKPYYEDSAVQIYLGDCRDILPHLPKVDLVLTDPPYESMRRWEGIGTTARMGMGHKGSGSDDPNKFFKTISNEELGFVLQQIYDVLKNNCHAYIMCDAITLPYLYYYQGFRKPCNPCIYLDDNAIVPFSNMKVLVWDKEVMGMGYHYRSQYELIVMFDKGKNRRLADLSKPDVLRFKRYQGEVPTQKPQRMFELLISQSTNEGELILDPFLGSGTTVVAAKDLGRKAIGIEISEKYCEIAAKRMAQGVLL